MVNPIVSVGSFLEHRGYFKLAEKFYRLSKTSDARIRAANVKYRQEDFESAAALFEVESKQVITDPQMVRRYAITLEKLGKLDAAESLLKKAVDSPDNELSVNKDLVRIMVRRGHSGDAREYLEQIVERQTDSWGCEQLLRLLPRNVPAWRRVRLMDVLASEYEKDPDWAYEYACVLQDANRLHDAAEWFDRALLLRRRSWWAYRAGLVHELLGETALAVKQYELAIGLDKKLGAAKWGIGVFHAQACHWDKAAKAFTDESSREGKIWRRAGLLHKAGESFARHMAWNEACKAYETALRMRPMNLQWREEYSVVLELSGRTAEALNELELVCSVCPNLHTATSMQWSIARLKYKLGDFAGALDELQPIFSSEEIEEEPVDKKSDATNRNALRAAVSGLTFWGSTDKCGHLERATLLREVGDSKGCLHELRVASLLQAPLADDVAHSLASLLEAEGREEEAARALFATQRFFEPLVPGLPEPKEGYESQLALYCEWRDLYPVEDDVILYEANLGISIDCNPLAICRETIKRFGSRYIHIWSIDGDASLPEDLMNEGNVIVVKKNSLAYTKALATAKYLVNNSTFPTYFTRRPEQRYLMTWHGTPLKALAKDMNDPLVHANMARNYLQSTLAIFPNQHTRDVLIRGCDVAGVMKGKICITGYPRNDSLTAYSRMEDSSGDNRPVALIAPTWRNEEQIPSQVQTIIELREKLERAGYKVLIRAHHYVEAAVSSIDSALAFVPRHIGTYDFLPTVDLLVTDFSSIYFDFAVTRRPIIFYVPDWNEYAEERGVYFEKNHLPGIVCSDLDDFEKALRTVESRVTEEFIREFCPMDDGQASERVVDEFFSEDTFSYTSDTDKDSPYLFRQSLIPNGMSTSFVNLSTALVESGKRVLLLTEADPVKCEEGRQDTLKCLSPSVQVIGRVGRQPCSRLEYAAMKVKKSLFEPSPKGLEEILEKAFIREADRVLPNSGIKASIEFDGYSEFMARLMLSIAKDNAKSIIYLHNDIVDEIETRMPELVSVARLYPLFDSAVSVSESLMLENQRKLYERFSIETDNADVATNVILPKRIAELSLEQIPEFSSLPLKDRDSKLFVHLGRFSPEKNHDFLLRMFSEYLNSGRKGHLALLGDGPLLNAMKALAIALGIDSFVSFLGRVNNPFPVVKHSAALLLPSLHEGQPMVILEALSLGTPVIASDIAATKAFRDQKAVFIEQTDDYLKWITLMDQVSASQVMSDFDADQYMQDCVRMFLDITR